jgi:hypothetical protein
MPLLEAVLQLRDKGLVRSGRFELRLVGTMDPAFGAEHFVARHALGELVRILPPTDRAGSLRLMAASHVLLLIQPGTQLQVPGKLFEYLPFRRHLLALASPTGATADLVRNYGLGLIAAAEDVDAIQAALQRFVEDFEAGRLDGIDATAALTAFDGRGLTGRLADVFTSLEGRVQARPPSVD